MIGNKRKEKKSKKRNREKLEKQLDENLYNTCRYNQTNITQLLYYTAIKSEQVLRDSVTRVIA